MKRFIILLCAIFLLIVAIYFYKPLFEDPNDNKETDRASNTSSTRNYVPTNTGKIYYIGDTVKAGDIDVIIHNATLGDPDPYAISKSGKVLTIELSAINNGKKPIWLIYNDFELYDMKQNKSDYYVGGNNFMPVSGQLQKDENLSGKIKFDVKSSYQNYYHLYYTPNFLSDTRYHWTIQVK